MEEMLMKYGYKNVEPNTWVKCDWTIRFDEQLIEIFNDPDKTPGKYYTYPIDKINLKDYLEEIDTYLLKEALIEPGIINQINNVPIYSYEKLTIEMVEKAISEIQKKLDESEEPKFVWSVFGTVEQVTKHMNEFNQVMTDTLNKMVNENEAKINKRR